MGNCLREGEMTARGNVNPAKGTRGKIRAYLRDHPGATRQQIEDALSMGPRLGSYLSHGVSDGAWRRYPRMTSSGDSVYYLIDQPVTDPAPVAEKYKCEIVGRRYRLAKALERRS